MSNFIAKNLLFWCIFIHFVRLFVKNSKSHEVKFYIFNN